MFTFSVRAIGCAGILLLATDSCFAVQAEAKPGGEAFTKGSVWRGTETATKPRQYTVNWELVVTERTGEHFTAELTFPTMRRRIEGTIKSDGSLTWKGTKGEPRPGHPHEGKIIGDKIECKITPIGDGVEGFGSLTLAKARTARPSVLGDFPDLASVTGPIGKDPNDVWRELADLMSFAYVPPDASPMGRMPLSQRLYVPFRSVRTTKAGSGYREADNAILYRFDQLVEAALAEQRLTAVEARDLFHKRLKLALANNVLGNTPDSSFITMAQFLAEGLWKLKEFEDQLGKDREAKKGLSLRSVGRFLEFQQSMQGSTLMEMIEKRKRLNALPAPAIFSGYMNYGDMMVSDWQAAFWQAHLVPLAQKAAGPKSAQPPIELTGGWRNVGGGQKFDRLVCFNLLNPADKPLTNAVVEIRMENTWGDKASQYYFFKNWPTEAYQQALPHQRWDKRVLPYVTELKVSYSVWADQVHYEGAAATLSSPNPNPDAEKWRSNYVSEDRKHQVDGELWSWAMMLMHPLPGVQKP